MKKVLIISTSFDEQTILEEECKAHQNQELKIETNASFGQEANWWVQNGPDVLVLLFPEDNFIQGYFFSKLRKDVPHSLPILVICNTVSSPLMKLSTEFSRVRILKTPLDRIDFYKQVVELTKDYGQGKSQFHPRYLVDQNAKILPTGKKESFIAQLKNVSLTGVYFESVEQHKNLEAGQILKIIIEIEGHRHYEFNAKVVWKKNLPDKNQIGYGVTFLDEQDVYDQMFKNL